MQLKNNTLYYVILFVLVVSGAGAFYWYQMRPSQIIQECTAAVEKVRAARADEQRQFLITDANALFRFCLTNKGMKPFNLVDQ